MTNTNAIERLRQSKAEFLADIQTEALEAAREWAADCATYEQLTKLAALDLDCAPGNDQGERGVLAVWVAEQIDANVVEVFGDELPLDAYAEAVFRAAADYFNEIKKQL